MGMDCFLVIKEGGWEKDIVLISDIYSFLLPF